METYFDHERLDVYQEAIAFIAWWTEIRPRCSGAADVQNQLDRASTSMPLNIAEGNGKYSMRDRSRYLQIAFGSALESAACLDVLVARKRLEVSEIQPGKRRLQRIVSMLVRFIDSVSNRIAEGEVGYELDSSLDSVASDGRPV
jgi:four helix bundle protein